MIFVHVVAIPIAIYSATRQYSIGDYVATFIGYIGLATPSFLLALILLYYANRWFGMSIGGLDGSANTPASRGRGTRFAVPRSPTWSSRRSSSGSPARRP